MEESITSCTSQALCRLSDDLYLSIKLWKVDEIGVHGYNIVNERDLEQAYQRLLAYFEQQTHLRLHWQN